MKSLKIFLQDSVPISLWCQMWYLNTSVTNDALHSLGWDRNMNEQLHSSVLVCVCTKYLPSDVNIKDVPRKRKEQPSHA